MTKRVFQISSELFWGYRVVVDILMFENISLLIQYIKQDLRQFLLSRNLKVLAEKLDERNFHIHHPFDSMGDIIKKTDDLTIIYVCDHCVI